MAQRIALGVSYDGAQLHGWQTQANRPNATAQELLETALSQIANHPVRVHCAGRTDAGVHATGQVVHFDTTAHRPERAWVLGVNSRLNRAVAVDWSVPVDEEFHARFSAVSRRYCYLIQTTSARPALFNKQVAWCPQRLNVPEMHLAAQCLLGEHDFSAFRAAGCQANSAIRNVSKVAVRALSENLVIIEIAANAFLYHMVRNIVGSLLQIGKGRQKPDWITELLQAKNRRLSAATAAAAGLYLTEVRYPSKFNFPRATKGPVLLAV